MTELLNFKALPKYEGLLAADKPITLRMALVDEADASTAIGGLQCDAEWVDGGLFVTLDVVAFTGTYEDGVCVFFNDVCDETAFNMDGWQEHAAHVFQQLVCGLDVEGFDGEAFIRGVRLRLAYLRDVVGKVQ